MGENFPIVNDSEVLDIYLNLIDEEIEELANQEIFKFEATPTPKPQHNKLSVFKVCNPFWLTYALLRGIFNFLWSPKPKPEIIYITRTSPCYRDINNWSDDDESDRYFLSKETQTDSKQIYINKIESALGELINLRKFKEIVPSNRKSVKKMTSYHHLKPFRTIDHRNRKRFGGKIIKPKLSKTSIFYKKNNCKDNNNLSLDVRDVMDHLLYVESSDDDDDDDNDDECSQKSSKIVKL